MGENEFYTFQNLIIYKLGSLGNAVKRAGLEVWNTRSLADVDTNQQIFQYISNSKSPNFSRFIVKSTTKTKYITSAGDSAYTDIIPSGDVTGKVRFLVFRDNLYILNRNTSGSYQSNKFYNGTDCKDMGLEPCPNNVGMEELTSKGYLGSANYKYIVTFVYDGLQESYFISNTAYGTTADAQMNGNAIFIPTGNNPAFIEVNPSGANSAYRMYNIPTSTTNARITNRRIYRTKSGEDTFYFLAEINATDTQFVDTTPDSNLFDPIDLQAIFKPPIAKYGVFHKDRMFIANLKENIYAEYPLNDSLSLSSITDEGAVVSGTGIYYTYKYYYLYLYPTLNTETGNPYQGFLGAAMTGTAYHHTANDTISISGITNINTYSKKVLLERAIKIPITGIALSGNEVTATVADEVDDSFNVGETIIVATTGMTNVNGTWTVKSFNTTSHEIKFDVTSTPSGSYTSGGTMMGEYHYTGITATAGVSFKDRLAQSTIKNFKGLLEQNGIEKLTSDKTLPSTLQWSDVNYGDSFPPDNSIEIEANDNDVITGIISEDDGVLIFKERNIYKLYTDREQSFWLLRKMVSNVGCTEPYSIVTIGTNTHLFNSNGHIYLYVNGQVKRISDKIQPILDGFGTVSNIDVCFDSFRNWVVWTYQYTQSAVVVQDMLVLDLNFPQDDNIGSWYHFGHVTITGDTPSNDGLTICSPLSAKDGSLLFGSTSNCIMQYGKTPQYKDTYHVAGVATDRGIDVKLTKYFDFDEWEIERFLGKFRLGGASSTTVSSSGKTTTKTTSGADTKVRVNTRVNTGKLQEEYIQAVMLSNVSFEIKELGFDYLPKHEKRGSF